MNSPHDAASPPEGAVDPDDADALSWGDENDATHVDAQAPIAVRASSGRERREGDGSGALVGFGVLGGIYLLYTVAWLISASLLPVDSGSSVSAAASEVLRVLAIMAPALWFVATLWLGQGSRNRTKFIWLVVGAVVLVPWPFIMTRSFG
jgi:hypothetical protein